MNKSKNKASSRQQIQIKEVKDDILILPNEKYRVILESSSINFELKSEEEQDVLIDSFQNFLNSLPCQLQILIRVREVDIDHYLQEISLSKKTEKEKAYKNQIDNYCDFISNLVAGNKILSRKFYIVIPYCHTDKNKDFGLVKEQLRLLTDIVIRAFAKMGMKARPINSLEILDLFYSFYNSGQIKTQALTSETLEKLLENKYV
ncbi:MAG: TraC family protein [Candidatus Pacebacteria bacterium]|nr:TraC family protein [Candidatus Shapirobacteria bacterium]MDD3940706.1 TraC family protein [Candidatus Paceibacterota bacterium]